MTASLLGVLVILGRVGTAAAVSIVGHWDVVAQSPSFPPAEFTEDIGYNGPFVVTTNGFSGTFDSASGAFHFHSAFHSCVDGRTGVSTTVFDTQDGTVDPGGTSFTGTEVIYLPDFLLPGGCAVLSYTIAGTRLGDVTPVCGNGLVDAGEDCDGGVCCTASCHFAAAGATCAGPDPACFDYVCSDTHACVRDPAQSDVDHDGIPDRCDTCTTGDPCTGPDACSLYHCVAGFIQCVLDPTSDSDHDGIGDGCDPCLSGGDLAASRLDVVNLEGQGPTRLRARGEIPLPAGVLAGLDPVANGMRFVVADAFGNPLINVTVPGGSGWKAARSGGAWAYRSTNQAPIARVGLRAAGGALRYRLRGSPVAVPAGSAIVPLTAVVGLDPDASAGGCGEHAYDGVSCQLQWSGRHIVCRAF